MRTLGIDLASEPKNTAACVVEWKDGGAVASAPVCWANGRSKLDDERLLDMIDEADCSGIDAPFGWPDSFVESVWTWSERGQWPDVDRKRLRFRDTDRFTADVARAPLSVSADRIAVIAMRCASLLAELGERWGRPVSRVGDERVVEVYPAAALVCWSDPSSGLVFDPEGYKTSDDARDLRQRLLATLAEAAPWLDLDAAHPHCVKSHDAFDALIAALVARAAVQQQVMATPPDQQATAEREGWIALPQVGSLSRLT